jgi:hypothetical protein
VASRCVGGEALEVHLFMNLVLVEGKWSLASPANWPRYLYNRTQRGGLGALAVDSEILCPALRSRISPPNAKNKQRRADGNLLICKCNKMHLQLIIFRENFSK